MRWFTRFAVCTALALCAWLALPGDAGAGSKPPAVHSVIEGRNSAGDPVVIVIGFKVNTFKTLSVRADDGVRAPYNKPGELVVKSGKLSVWKLPPGIESDRGPDLYDLVFTYGRKATEFPVNVRLNFGAAAPKSVSGTSIDNGTIDTQHMSAGLLANLEDASTLEGFDSDFFRDAANLTGTLDTARFSAWDDLMNEENRVGTGPGQLALGNHTHPGSFYLQSELNGDGGVINTTTNPVDWTRLKSVPLGLADGEDADTTYSASAGLTQTGTIFGVDFGGGGAADTVARSDHDHGNVFAPIAHDHDTRYLTKTQLSTDDSTVNDADDPVHWSQLAGVPTQIADGVDDNTTYIAGTGLSLASGTFSVNLSGNGTANSAARSDHDHTSVYADASHAHDSRYATKTSLASDTGIINSVGNAVDWSQLKNVPDAFADGTDDSIVYSAGTGLTVSTNKFSVLYGGTGSSTTVAHADHDHTTIYQPAFNTGTGLNLSLNTLAVAFGGNGSDTNVARADHNHNSIYPLGSTLSSAGGTINQITNPLDWSQLKSVPTGFIDGLDDDTQYTAGTGLSLVNTEFAADFAGGGSADTVARSDHDHSGQFLTLNGSSNGTISLTSSGTTVTATNTDSSGAAGRFEASEAAGGSAYGVEAISAGHIAVRAAGKSHGVYGTSSSTTGRAGWFQSTATSGTSYGVFAEAGGPGGIGAYLSGKKYGAEGFSSADSGIGLRGFAWGKDAIGVQGEGIQGVVGIGNGSLKGLVVANSTIVPAGVRGYSAGGYGVHGIHHKDSFVTNSVTPAAGVFGEATTTSSGYGVLGQGGPAIAGKYTSGTGVWGRGATGVYGTSDKIGNLGAGVRGVSISYSSGGVHGRNSHGSGWGVYGENTSTSGTSHGVYGVTSNTSVSGAGVYGHATTVNTGVGVWGSGLWGVRGSTGATDGRGVYGQNVATSGAIAYGVYGSTKSTTAAGVIGVGHETTANAGTGVLGTGLRGVHGATGAAGGIGIFGENIATSGSTAYGVMGVTDSTTAVGVYGLGHSSNTGTGTGVMGDGEVGVKGMTSATSGVAVRGESTHTTGATRALYGTTVSSAGIAGLLVNSAGGSSSTVLQVEHTDTVTTTGDLAVFKDQGSNVARIDRSGQGFFNGGTATSGADIAESVAVDRPKAEFEPGDVMVVDRKTARTFAKSGKRNSPLVAGIYATKPGVLLRPGQVDDPTKWAHREVPMAVTGIVPCKVCDENGKVEIGDLLVTASKPGYAMKAPDDPKAGTLVGKALENLDGRSGKVEVLITMR